MKFPLTSRGRLDDAHKTIERLERELVEMKQDRERLLDVIAVKAVGFSVYGKVQVPKDSDDEPEPRKYSPEKDSLEPMVAKPEEAMPRRARDVVRKTQRENLAQAEQEQQIVDRAIAADRERRQLAALVRNELAPVVDEGIKAAEAANGNGRH